MELGAQQEVVVNLELIQCPLGSYRLVFTLQEFRLPAAMVHKVREERFKDQSAAQTVPDQWPVQLDNRSLVALGLMARRCVLAATTVSSTNRKA